MNINNIPAHKKKKPFSTSDTRESDLWNVTFNNDLLNIAVADAKGNFIDANEGFCTLFGYQKEELIGVSLTFLFPGKNRIKTAKIKHASKINKKEESTVFHGNWQCIRRDHLPVHVKISSNLIDYYGNSAILLMALNITDKLEASESKEFEKSDYEALLNNTDDLIWSVNPKLKLIAANKAFINGLEELSGIILKPGDELLNKDIFPEEYLTLWEGWYKKTLLGESFKKEIYTPAFNNWKESWADISFNPVFQDDAIVAVACYSRDITEKKLADEMLKQNEAQLNEAQELAKVGSWETDLSSYKVIWTRETYRIFEIDPEKFQASHLGFLEFVHPDDREKVETAFISSLNKNSVTTIEHRILTADGITKTVEERWRIFRDEQGKPTRAVGTCRDITEQKKADEQLKQSELRYRSLVEQATDAICIADAAMNIIDINPVGCQMLGYNKEEFLQLTLADLFFQEDLDSNPFKFDEINKGKAIRNERRFKRKDGTWINLEISVKLLEDARLVVFARDITERKKAENELQAAYHEKNTILESIDDGFFALDKNSIVTYWNKRAEILLNAKREDVIGQNLHDMFGKPGAMEFHDKYQKAIRENSTIHFAEFSKRSNKWFSVSAFASDKGLSVYFKDITERKNNEEAVKLSNERYNIIGKVTNDMVWDWNLLTNQVYRNKEGWRKIFRTEEQEIEHILTDDWDERVHPEDREKLNLILNGLQSSEKDFFEIECRVRRDDDSYAFIHDRGYIIRNEQGKAIRVLGASQDISERKEAELQLAKSEIRFRSLVQNSSDFIGVLDKKGYYLYASPAIERIMGYDPEFVIGKNAFAFIHPDDTIAIKEYLSKVRAEGYSQMPAFRYKNSNGKWRWLESKITDMTENPDVQGYIFNTRDVTERKIAEDEISKLSIIARETANAVIITDPEEKIVWVNEAFSRITEFEFEEVIGKKPGELLQGEETNLAVVHFMRQKIKDIQPFECDIVNYSKSGKKYWLRIQCQPQFDKAGNFKYFFAIQTDITKEKEAEEILKKSEERYRYLFNNNPASIIIWDLDSLQILEVNDTSVNQYGYNREEFLNKTILDLRLPEYHDKLKQFASMARQDPDFKSLTIWNHISKSGEEMYMNIDSHRIQLKGKSAILAIASNITENVLLEKELEKEKFIKQQEITAAVISAQEQERQELGLELHDNINQILAGSLLYLGLAKKELNQDHPYLQETAELVSSAINEIRNLSHSLIPPSLNESEFLEALDNLIETTQKASGIMISLQAFSFNESMISDKLKLNIYRIVQEQFNNILKHAAATKVIVRLAQDNEKTVLSIKDDGVGFDTGKKADGVGLMNIKTRASLFNGELTIISSLGRGCELKVIFN